MSKGSSSRARRPLSLLAIVAVLGMTMTLTTVGTAVSSPGHAVAAKKCKKKKKGKKKKKKCKKRRVVLPAPLLRATVSWTENAEIDLHAFDALGNHAGWTGGSSGGVVQGIPNAAHSGDRGPFGPSESFTDNIFVAGGLANREFSYKVCFYGNATAGFTGVGQDGRVYSQTLTETAGTAITLTPPGGPATPPADQVC
jgi:hypothetical protein